MYTALHTFILTLIFAINVRKQLRIFFIFLKVPLPYSKFILLKTMFNVIFHVDVLPLILSLLGTVCTAV